MREAGLIHRTRLEPLRLSGRRVVQELQHQSVAHEIRGRHPERWRKRQELGRALVGRRYLALERKAEQLAIEALRTFEIRDALADMIERGHCGESATRTERNCLSSLVKQRPVARSNCQWCKLHVRTPSSISPNCVRSAWRCGQKRSMRQPSRSKNSSACSRRSRYERSTCAIRSGDSALKNVMTNSLKFDGSGR